MTKEEEVKKVMALANKSILNERIHKIDMVMREYGEENFYLAFSGGRDSTVLHHLLDIALPGNTIPRVYSDTGIEYKAVRQFVFNLAVKDDRIQIIKPQTPIKQMLERDGYPFKSKFHAQNLYRYQKGGLDYESVRIYLNMEEPKSGIKKHGQHLCPKILRYQFTPDFTEKLKVSDLCCQRLKKEPMQAWQKENKRPYSIIGIMAAEGGQRETAKCTVFKDNKLKAFQPLAPLTKEWEDWFIEEYKIQLAPLYYPPYNFSRTGCKGCPFALELQQELDTLDKYFPYERLQCERIWGPVYEEYRRIGYRKMRPLDEGRQITIDEFITPEE